MTLQVLVQSSCVMKLFWFPRQPPYAKGTHMPFCAMNVQRWYRPRHGPGSASSMQIPAKGNMLSYTMLHIHEHFPLIYTRDLIPYITNSYYY